MKVMGLNLYMRSFNVCSSIGKTRDTRTAIIQLKQGFFFIETVFKNIELI